MKDVKCPVCGSCATKIYNLSTGKIECQLCGARWRPDK
jgi:ribosomal protein S27E